MKARFESNRTSSNHFSQTQHGQGWVGCDNERTPSSKFECHEEVFDLFTIFIIIVSKMTERVDLTKPKWDQSTYLGRVKHFTVVTNPLNLFCSNAELDKAREVVTSYKYIHDPIHFQIYLNGIFGHDSAADQQRLLQEKKYENIE